MGSNCAAVAIAIPSAIMLLIALCLCVLVSVPALGGKPSDRQERLGLLSIVKFANDPCGASNGSNGTCLSSNECSAISGTASGACADGFGVCCVLSIGCGGSTTTNNTYIAQSSTTSSASCSYTVCPASTDICQIRIDFEKFVMAGASTTTGTKGRCSDDSLAISNPSGPNPPLVCGTLTGQHMYFDASTSCHTSRVSTVLHWDYGLYLQPGLRGDQRSGRIIHRTSEQPGLLHLLQERGGILQHGVLCSHHRVLHLRQRHSRGVFVRRLLQC